MTDGSGSASSRIQSSIEILQSAGCTPGRMMGAFTDREIYRLLLNGDAEPIVAMTIEIAESLIEHDIRSVVTDAFEMYNPTHDLCSVVAGLAAERASAATRHSITVYEYAVTQAPFRDEETVLLDDAALERKLAAARRYDGLRSEVETLVERIGVDGLRRETFKPVTASARPKPASKPFYETYGEKQVAAGHYDTVIRYDPHFLSFVDRLTARLGEIAVPDAVAACRS